MEGQSTSSSTPKPEFVFSDLLSLLNNIPHRTCGSTNCANARFYNCDKCRFAKQITETSMTMCKLSGFEKDMFNQMEPLRREGAFGGCSSRLVVDPRFRKLFESVHQFKHHLLSTINENPAVTSEQQEEETAPPPSLRYVLAPGALLRGDLTEEERICLKCCSVFNKRGFKKRMMINWWIGEGLLPTTVTDPNGEATGVEKACEVMFDKLEKRMRLIIKRQESVSMEEGLSDFIADDGILAPGKAIMLKSDTDITVDDKSPKNEFERVINVNRHTISTTEARAVAYMDSLKVLHLGRSMPSESIQVQGLNLIMDRLKKKKQLKLLSLQGIRSISEVPISVCNVTSLMVLDLRACQALRSLPSCIGNLKSLTHLDMSECYILLPLPMEISSLSELEVLKGFVIAPPNKGEQRRRCTLRDLRKLKKLRKLSISVSTTNFPQQQDLIHLANISELFKLEILWTSGSKPEPRQNNAGSTEPRQDNAGTEPHQNNARTEPRRDNADTEPIKVSSTANTNPIQNGHAPKSTMFKSCLGWKQMEEEEEQETDVFEKLEKLELMCTPKDVAPLLLAPDKFPMLKQLYIIGAEFHHLNYGQQGWNVENLKLMYSPNLVINRGDWTRLFPKVSHRRQVKNCPNVELPSTDEEHVVTA